MIATSHVIIGGTIGVLTKNPALGFVAGVVSHLICDAIPHLDSPFKIEFKDNRFDQPVWDKKLVLFALTDSLAAFFLTLFLWHKLFGLSITPPAFAWGALGAYLPDFLDNTPFWNQQLRKFSAFNQFHKFHIATHNLWLWKFPMPQYWLLGTLTQIVAIVPCLWFLINSK